MGIVYRADPPSARCLVALDALDLIYHRPSGMTHIVSEPVPQILDVLTDGPADAEAIVARLLEQHDFDPEGAVEAVDARLAELEAIGLVERA
ncbi:MAG: HPr-rel-A system PqqD family peptide chaperone [Sphingobium sp.]